MKLLSFIPAVLKTISVALVLTLAPVVGYGAASVVNAPKQDCDECCRTLNCRGGTTHCGTINLPNGSSIECTKGGFLPCECPG